MLDESRLHRGAVGDLGPSRPPVEEVGHQPEEQGGDGDVRDHRKPSAARVEDPSNHWAQDPTLAPEALLVLGDTDRECRLMRITERLRPVHRPNDPPASSRVQPCPRRPPGLTFRDAGLLWHVSEVY